MKKVNKKLTKIAVEAWGKYEKKKLGDCDTPNELKMPLDWIQFTNIVFEAFIEGYIKGYNQKGKEKKQ